MLWYKDDLEKELKHTIDLNNCKCKSSQRKIFQIIKSDGTMLMKDLKSIEFSASTEEEAEDWKASLMAVGVFPEYEEKKSKSMHNIFDPEKDGDIRIIKDINDFDPLLQKQIELIKLFIETYFKIVIKTQTDLTGKIIVFMVVNKVILI